jgi:TIR domain
VLFISHSSADLAIAEALVDLLRSALPLRPDQVRCSSLDGFRLPGGADIDDRLRREVDEAQAFIGLVSYRSLRSLYVVFELGARWGARKPLVPLLAPGVPASVLPAPLSGLNALSCEIAGQLQQLVSEIAGALDLSPYSPATYQREVDRVLALPAAPPEIHLPKALRDQLELSFQARRARLPPSLTEMLAYLEVQSKLRASVPQQDLEAEFGRRFDSVYWRLEALCHLGFVEKEVTNFRGHTPTFNYRLSDEYGTSFSASASGERG